MLYHFLVEVLWIDCFSAGLVCVRFAGDKARMCGIVRCSAQLQALLCSFFRKELESRNEQQRRKPSRM